MARAQRRHCEAELPSQEAYWLLGYLPGEKDPGQGWSEAGAATGGSDCSDLGSVCAITGLLVFRQPRPPRGPERSAGAAAAAAWPTSTTRASHHHPGGVATRGGGSGRAARGGADQRGAPVISTELSAVPLCSSCSSRTPFCQAIEPGTLLHRHRQVRRAPCQRPSAERRGGCGRGASGCCSCCHRVGDAARASAPGPGPGQLHTAARVSARSVPRGLHPPRLNGTLAPPPSPLYWVAVPRGLHPPRLNGTLAPPPSPLRAPPCAPSKQPEPYVE
eukprot:COSAG01_NODE_316_length_19004_cov_100.001322_6_plen_275_part_00